MSVATTDYIGNTFGRLTVIDYLPGQAGVHAKAVCACRCGATITAFITNLKRGFTNSCGCLNQETRIAYNTRHGLTDSPEHHIWTSMIQRCTNKNNQAYQRYGGRGIMVCERWMRFLSFYEDMGPRPSAAHSLDRWPDQNGNYEKANCRWASRKEQNRNRRSNRFIAFNGQTKTMAEWSEETGLSPATIGARLRIYGYSDREALMTPLYERNRNGRTLNS